MARDQAHLNRRNRLIQEDFKKMSAEKSPKGNTKYTSAYIFEKLSEKYFISEKSVYRIIISDIPEDKNVQLSMFNEDKE